MSARYMSAYTPTIGLEIHAELKTRTKMFCDSANDPHAAEPNAHICPVCMAFPGTLPVINKEAVRHVLNVGVSMGGKLAEYTEFDRKNYFYPDIPKGYQISQYKYPLISGGSLFGVALTRIHLEEDTARSQHTGGSFSLIDFNRAGVPLMELVTEPVIHDAETAMKFAQELQLLLRTLGASDANMEKGEMRVEANISISKNEMFGTKVEVKNINSFRAVGRAIAFEIARQTELLERGDVVTQETRGWDENRGETFSQRSKENAKDYRYFPEPDLPKLNLSRIAEFSLGNIRSLLPKMPWEKREHYLGLGLKSEDTEILLADVLYADFFESEILDVVKDKKLIMSAMNYLMSDVRGANPNEESFSRLKNGVFLEIITMVDEGLLSSRGAKDIIAIVLAKGGSPKDIAKRDGLLQVHDADVIKKVALEVISEHPEIVSDVKNGKASAIQFLVGQGMKKSKGSLNPSQLVEVLRKEVGS